MALSALVAVLIGIDFIAAPPPDFVFRQEAWTWIAVAGFSPRIGFYLDALSLVMVLVVTVISFLIHLYSTEFMSRDEGYARFFAYMNLFVGSMCILVLADNLLFLYLGWEGVGLCSYLLIGFWYRDPANGRAARKAFIVTRVGDTAMAIGLFLLFTHLGTLDIQPLMQRATQQWPEGSGLAIPAAALLLAGAVGKSAQLPLQTWLPDAMAGPTPVSALIHAATMVTAGVYLIARTHVLFTLAPASAACGSSDRRPYPAAGGIQCARSKRHQARAGLFDHQPDRLYVPCSGSRRLVSGHLSPDDARLLQGSAVPERGRGHHEPARGT